MIVSRVGKTIHVNSSMDKNLFRNFNLKLLIRVPFDYKRWLSEWIVPLNQIVCGIFFGLVFFDKAEEFLSDLFDLVFHCV